MSMRTFTILVVLVLSLMIHADAPAAVVGVDTPQQINNTTAASATMAVPRWKGYVSPTNPDRFWAMHSGGSSTATNLIYTDDAGETWNDTGMHAVVDGYLNNHASLFGHGNDLYITSPQGIGIRGRHWNAPAESNDDRGILMTVPGTDAGFRSNNMVDGNGRWWIFTRYSDNANENVEYAYSDDEGAHWTYGDAYNCGQEDIRIGSMPGPDGAALLVVLYLQSDRGYEYYKWNGTRFVALPDHTLWSEYIGWERRFTHNVVGDYIHLVFRDGDRLRHVWKAHNGGQGSWNTSLVPTGASDLIDPVSTARGDELYLFYSLQTNDNNPATARVRAIVWDQNARAWGDEIDVSTASTHNVMPNTCFQVPLSANYIPVFWAADNSGTDIMFSKLLISSTHVDTPDVTADRAMLLPGYPNPFNPRTTIPFSLPRDATARLSIYDTTGRLVTVLADGAHTAGEHEVSWLGRDRHGNGVPSGVYHVRLVVGGEVSNDRVTLIR